MQKQKRNHKDMANKSGAKRTNEDRGTDAGNAEAESNIWHMRVLSTIQKTKMTNQKSKLWHTELLLHPEEGESDQVNKMS